MGEVRSLISETVNVMALTATATRDTRMAVCHKLGMVCPVIVSQVPNKPNIMYTVFSHPGTLEDTFGPRVEEIADIVLKPIELLSKVRHMKPVL